MCGQAAANDAGASEACEQMCHLVACQAVVRTSAMQALKQGKSIEEVEEAAEAAAAELGLTGMAASEVAVAAAKSVMAEAGTATQVRLQLAAAPKRVCLVLAQRSCRLASGMCSLIWTRLSVCCVLLCCSQKRKRKRNGQQSRKATKRLARKLFAKIDKGGNGLVDFEEVQNVLQGKQQFSRRKLERYKQQFEASDFDGNGQLDLEEFEQLLQAVLEAEAPKAGTDGPRLLHVMVSSVVRCKRLFVG